MKNKKLLYFCTVIFMGILLGLISILLVGRVDTALAEKNNISISDNIAIVNQDKGFGEGKGYLNYGEKVIETLDENFIVTSREIAKKGMENGNYAAMVILPGIFSENINSINSEKPEKVQFYYETSHILSDVKRAQIERDMLALERNINDKLSYLYIANILNEFHNSQDKVEYVLKNDQADLKSIESINDNDLIKAIDLRELEKFDIDINTLDLSNDFEVNENIMKEMDIRYKEYLAESELDLNNIKNEGDRTITNKDTGLLAYLNDIASINMLPSINEDGEYIDIIKNVKDANEELVKNESNVLREKQKDELSNYHNSNIVNNAQAKNELIEQTNIIKDNIDVSINLEENQKLILDALNLLKDYIQGVETETADEEIVVPEIIIDTWEELNKEGLNIEKQILDEINQINAIYQGKINSNNKIVSVLKEENKINSLISAMTMKSISTGNTTDIKISIANEIKRRIRMGEINFEIVKEDLRSSRNLTINTVEEYIEYIFSEDGMKQYEKSKTYNDLNVNIPNIQEVKVSDKMEDSIIQNLIKDINIQLENNLKNINERQNICIKENMNNFNQDHENRYKSIKDIYVSRINEIKGTTITSLESINRGIDGLLSKLNEELGNKNNSNKGLLETIKDNVGKVFGWLDKSTENTNANVNDKLKTNVDQNETVLKNSNIANEIILRENIRNVESETKKELENILVKKHQPLELLQESINEYNPINYITKNQNTFDKLISDYDKNNKLISNQIQEQDNKNIKFTEETYEKADEHVNQLREDVLKTKDESEKLITEGLNDAKILKEKNSIDNKSKMGEFTQKLPYTRVGTLDNTYMYDFIATPMQGIDSTLDKDLSTESTQNNILKEYKIYIIASLIVILFVIIMLNKNKNKNNYKGGDA